MNDLNTNIDQVMENAQVAFRSYKNATGVAKAELLRSIGNEIEALGDELIDTVMRESGLPEGRVRGERGRTVNQLAQFADLVAEGSWVEATIDTGDPARTPAPKPDLRKMLVPIGPVVVFGAGNFPLAFSVAGGDTASALAGGNSVVVKAHPAHLETSRLVAKAIKIALKKADLPEGIFEMIEGDGYEPGTLLVKHPVTKAVGFTGSEKGGMALYQLAAEREEPIPVFAEMGSINPVVILPKKLESGAKEIASNLVASVNLGAGQFCTNPGLIITSASAGFDEFVQVLSSEAKAAAANKMFSDSVYRNYTLNKEKIVEATVVSLIGEGEKTSEENSVVPAIAKVDAQDFIKHPNLHQEIFGPFSLVVECQNEAQIKEVIASLKGQLTATLYAEDEEISSDSDWVDLIQSKCGRLLFGGVPTGVEVCAAMQHGGPFPSSSDARFTSVGLSAIKRFVRPVAYQDAPQFALPDELKDENPLDIWRMVNNVQTKERC